MRLIEHIFGIIAPSDCLGCGEEGSLLCAWCVEAHIPEEVPRCYRCNRLTKRDWVCTGCRAKAPFRHLWVRTMHTETARQLVHRMKFLYAGEAADIIGDELAAILPALPPETVIVPVPTITSHVRQRGYDHTRRMTRHIAAQTNLPCHTVLARRGQHRQVGSSRSTRLRKVNDSFRVRQAYLVAGRPVLLIDDVLTTGATAAAAAAALKAAGASRVDVAVFARAK